MSCQDKKRDAYHKTDEHLKIDLLFRGETQVALLGDFRVVIHKANARETDECEQR